MLTRYNRKTVTVITDDGRQWNVSPSFLRRVGPSQRAKIHRDQRRPTRQTLMRLTKLRCRHSMRGPRAPTSEIFLVQYGVGLSCLGSVEF
jgi:hypothetical protein